MKTLFIFTTVILLFAACSKSDSPLGNASYIQYRINGILIRYNGDYNSYATGSGEGAWVSKIIPSSGPGFPYINYGFIGLKPLNQSLRTDQTIGFNIVTDSLKVQTYIPTDSANHPIAFVKEYAAIYTTGVRPTDKIMINISRYSFGSIDGTFTGQFTETIDVNGVVTYNDGVITQGEFKNLKVMY
jgi:hypothetical protein